MAIFCHSHDKSVLVPFALLHEPIRDVCILIRYTLLYILLGIRFIPYLQNHPNYEWVPTLTP